MLAPGQTQHLGNRSLMLIVYRKTTLAFVLFLCSIIIAFIGPSLATGIAGITSFGSVVNESTVNYIYSIINSLDLFMFLISIILFFGGFIIGMIQYNNHTFNLEEFGIKMQKGIINKTEVSIPYRQIQDIDLFRSLSHRLFGVSRLIMITAGHEDEKNHEESDTIFDPIDAILAEEIRTYLDKKIGVQVITQLKE